MSEKRDYYEVLGVDKSAGDKDTGITGIDVDKSLDF